MQRESNGLECCQTSLTMVLPRTSRMARSRRSGRPTPRAVELARGHLTNLVALTAISSHVSRSSCPSIDVAAGLRSQADQLTAWSAPSDYIPRLWPMIHEHNSYHYAKSVASPQG